jgi:hypothetical protein
LTSKRVSRAEHLRELALELRRKASGRKPEIEARVNQILKFRVIENLACDRHA